LKLWDGMSSMGGIVGGLITAFILLRVVKKVRLSHYLDAYFYAFTFGWTLARLGCTLVHDHPGALSDFVLAIQYPCTDDPSQVCARHDLGFYEFIAFGALSIYFYVTRFKPRFPGFYVLSWGLVMGPLRFAADYLRIDPTQGLGGDLRYGGLTPAQYAIIPLFLISIYAFVKMKRSGELLTPEPVGPEPPPQAPKKGKKK
ncbi:MAG: prolipoprotein diacylglyceryl transferase, partial [Myxococcota bacterium]|nr:prolipoprotein diacylglyceryl transferase [Myxococcota bacterium]